MHWKVCICNHQHLEITNFISTLKKLILLLISGKDIIGLAETGSGKTGAFALPILQSLLDEPQRLHSIILTPTRELAFQIMDQFEAIGSSIGIKCGMYVRRDIEQPFLGAFKPCLSFNQNICILIFKFPNFTHCTLNNHLV